MRYLITLLAAALCLTACAQKKFNPTLKRQLDSVMVLDQKYRELLSALMMPNTADSAAKANHMTPQQATGHFWALQNAIDSSNVVFVENIFKRYGYPGKSLVGDSTSEAAWYVIQHSKKIDTYIPLIKKTADSHELPFHLYAMMLDRELMNHDKEQIYGTQGAMRTLKATGKNEWIIWPIKDPDHVNELRKKVGFPQTVEQNADRMGIKYRVVKLDEVVLK